jgi:malonyl-CoA O-methyltransferase
MTTSLSWLRAEIQRRMLDKLEPIKLSPKHILIEPDFSGLNRRSFIKRFPGTQIDTILDPQIHGTISLGVKLKQALDRALLNSGRLLDRGIPVNASYDLILSNLCLQNFSNPSVWLARCHQHLTEGGLISFAYLGPDTGKELRDANPEGSQIQTLPGALDMHDIGDALVQGRYSDPVMDMEYLYLEYETGQALYEDGLALGLISAGTQLHQLRVPNPLKLTLEIVYGHAWVLAKNLSTGDGKSAYIRVDAIKRK